MRAGRLGASLLFLLPGISFGADFGIDRWTWSQKVFYQENHDPSIVWLSDGRKMQVDYGRLSWEAVDRWPRGKELALTYDIAAGLRLVDAESKKALAVVNIVEGPKTHPIDLALDECLEAAESGHGRCLEGAFDEQCAGGIESRRRRCYLKAESLWDAELNRAYQTLLKSVPESRKRSLKKAQRAWRTYRDRQSTAMIEIYGDQDGAVWHDIAGERRVELVREQAQRLATFMAWSPR